jgi:hypothetical protein
MEKYNFRKNKNKKLLFLSSGIYTPVNSPDASEHHLNLNILKSMFKT